MGRCAKRILNTKWTERRRFPELQRAAYTRDIQAKSKASSLCGISPEKVLLYGHSWVHWASRWKHQWDTRLLSPLVHHSFITDTDRAPDVVCSFYVAAHLSRCSSSSSPPSHTHQTPKFDRPPHTHPDPRRTGLKSFYYHNCYMPSFFVFERANGVTCHICAISGWRTS